MQDQKVGHLKEVEPLEENGTVDMKSRGLGDSIANFTKKTGIKNAVNKISKKLNIPCGCEARQESLNNMFPYKMKK